MREEQKLNLAFDIELGELEERIGHHVNGDFGGYTRIVPLKNLSVIRNMAFFRKDIFNALIKNITIRGTDHRPYANSEIDVYGREPKGFKVGQTFALESKILGIMRDLEGNVFANFISKGLSKMPPTIIYGEDSQGKKAIAFYIPPIIEIHLNNDVALIDGIHRSYIVKSAGTTANGVHITGVDAALPFDSIPWSKLQLVDEKPPIEKRYVNLRKDLFRDLSYVGIDG